VYKRIILKSLSFIFLLGLFLNLVTFSCFSQESITIESITITTYYPSPYGVYDQMRANKMVIGDPDSTSTPSPDTNGVVRFKGISSDPTGFNDTKPGALYYNTSDDEFKYHDGTGWQALGGGGICFTYYCNIAGGGGEQCTDSGGSQGYCPSGFQQKYALGSWGSCAYGATNANSFFRPPGGSCSPSLQLNRTFGHAYLCCQ